MPPPQELQPAAACARPVRALCAATLTPSRRGGCAPPPPRRDDCLASGMTAFLSKPVRPEVLRRTIAEQAAAAAAATGQPAQAER